VKQSTRIKKNKRYTDSGWADLLAYFIELEKNELKKKKVAQ